MTDKSTYTVLTPEAHVTYHDGNIAEDYACIGIVEATDPDRAVKKAVETISPIERELAESTEFLVFEVTGERHYTHYDGTNDGEAGPHCPA